MFLPLVYMYMCIFFSTWYNVELGLGAKLSYFN